MNNYLIKTSRRECRHVSERSRTALVQLRQVATAQTTSKFNQLFSTKTTTTTSNTNSNHFNLVFAYYLFIQICINLLKPLIACNNNKLQLKLLLAVHAALLITCIVSVFKSIHASRQAKAASNDNCEEEIIDDNENGGQNQEKDVDETSVLLHKPPSRSSLNRCFFLALVIVGKLSSIIMSGFRESTSSHLVVFRILIKCKCLKILV